MTLAELIDQLIDLSDRYGYGTRVEVDDGRNLDPIQCVEPDPENENLILVRIDPEATP